MKREVELNYMDFNKIENLNQLDFRYIIGSIRLILEKLMLKSESDVIVNKFLKYKFKTHA